MAYKEFRGIGPNKYGSPLKQEGGKFSTTAHDYGKRAAKMSKKERSDYREGLAKGLPLAAGVTPVGRVAGVAAGVVARNIGGGAHAIGQGLVRKFGTKKMKKTYDMLTNAPRQYSTKPNQPNINFARKTDVIGKGESYGNVRAFNKPGMKKTHFGPKKK